MATLRDLLKKLDKLPQPVDLAWPGVEQYSDGAFEKEMRTFSDAKEYIKALKERVAEQGVAIVSLKGAYNGVIEWIHSVELD